MNEWAGFATTKTQVRQLTEKNQGKEVAMREGYMKPREIQAAAFDQSNLRSRILAVDQSNVMVYLRCHTDITTSSH